MCVPVSEAPSNTGTLLHCPLQDMANSELQSKLDRQQQINDGQVAGGKAHQSVYAEFKEFSIPEIKEFKKQFTK